VTFSSFINYFAKQKDFLNAEIYYNLMKKLNIRPNVVVCTNILEAYLKSSELEKAKLFFENMKNEKIRPNLNTYSVWINYFGTSGEVKK